MGLPQKMDINVAHHYSHLGEKLLPLTYDDIGVHLTGAIEIYDGCACLKKNIICLGRKHMHGQKYGRNIFVDRIGPFAESLIGEGYCIGVIDDYICYS